METELSEFEQQMRREINAFMDSEQETRRKAATSPPEWPVEEGGEPKTKAPRSKPAGAPRTGHLVKLAVRTKQLEMDSVFEHVSSSISKVEAQLEAEKAARKAGYPIIGYVVETRRL
ncbi:hypothetical protein FHR95_002906 [Halomonas fontilapidosi]|uniref:Uncharacterized protein n=1 Tax=Halomonas fontilapidosi TaxID=616675 RepID=A0A7W5DMG2_9GAMM|nr:hypothetical protein [Halomonas fontilapidosi]MBB3185325.1 hypothetical protein [Halomonas fontilapidosi]